MYYREYASPVGKLLLTSDGEALTGLWMNREPPSGAIETKIPVLRQAEGWLDGYFRGEGTMPDFPVAPEGTVFQKQVWEILLTIPFGKTRSYGEIGVEVARRMGRQKMSPQAIGGAVGRNPISIIIPCHRVIGAKGQLVGYAGGLDKKKWLLRHEGSADI